MAFSSLLLGYKLTIYAARPRKETIEISLPGNTLSAALSLACCFIEAKRPRTDDDDDEAAAAAAIAAAEDDDSSSPAGTPPLDEATVRRDPVDLLLRLFPAVARGLLQDVLLACHGDVVRAIEQLLNQHPAIAGVRPTLLPPPPPPPQLLSPFKSAFSPIAPRFTYPPGYLASLSYSAFAAAAAAAASNKVSPYALCPCPYAPPPPDK